MRTTKKIRDSYVLKHFLFLVIFSVTVNHYTTVRFSFWSFEDEVEENWVSSGRQGLTVRYILKYFQQTCTIKPEKQREVEVGLRPSMPSHDSSIFVDFRGEMVNNVIWKVAPKAFNGERYSRNSPFVFVGGHPRSGTTLMRSMFGRLTVAPYNGHFCPCRSFSLFSLSLSVLEMVISTVRSTLNFN